MQDALPPAWQKLVALRWRQLEFLGDPVGGIRHARLAGIGQAEYRQHKRLIVWYRHLTPTPLRRLYRWVDQRQV
jgi:hypothetical protein